MATTSRPVERLAYSPREVAEALGLADSTVRQMIADGRLDHARVGHRVLVSAETLRRVLVHGVPS